MLTKKTHAFLVLFLILSQIKLFLTFGFFAFALAAKNILLIVFGLTAGFLTFYIRKKKQTKLDIGKLWEYSSKT